MELEEILYLMISCPFFGDVLGEVGLLVLRLRFSCLGVRFSLVALVELTRMFEEETKQQRVLGLINY